MANVRDDITAAYAAVQTPTDPSVLGASLQLNPDELAKNLRESDRTGVPPSAVPDYKDLIHARDVTKAYDDLAISSPKSHQWASQNAYNMALLRDATEPSARIEAAFQKAKKEQAQQARPFLDRAGDVATGAWVAAGSILPRTGAGLLGLQEAFAELFIDPTARAIQRAAGVSDYSVGEQFKPGRRAYEKQAGELGSVATETMVAGGVPEGISSGVTSGFQMVGQVIPALIAPSAALPLMTGTVAGEEYGKARDKGLDPLRAAVYGTAQGGVEFLTERFAMGRFLEAVKKGNPIAKAAVGMLAKEIPGEQMATAIQDLNQMAALEPEKTLAQYWQERPDAALQTLVATLVGGGSMVTVSAAVDQVNRAVYNAANKAAQEQFKTQESAVQARDAEQTFSRLKDAITAANEHPLRARHEGKFHEFLTEVLQESDLSEVYFDAKTLNDTLLQSGADLEALKAKMPSVVAQIQEGYANEGTVRVSTADLLTHIQDQGLQNSLLSIARRTPDGMTYDESQAFFQTQTKELEAKAQEIDKQTTPTLTKDEYEASIADQATPEELTQLAQSRLAELSQTATTPEQVQEINTLSEAVDQPEALAQLFGKQLVAEKPTYVQHLKTRTDAASVRAVEVENLRSEIIKGMRAMNTYTESVVHAMATPLTELYRVNSAKMNMLPSELMKVIPIKFLAEQMSGINQQEGNKATRDTFNKDNIKDVLSKTDWAILTAENPNKEILSAEENAQRNAALEEELKAAGYDYIKVDGIYDRPDEKSFIVLGIPEEKATAFGNKYQQDSILTREGFIYQDGTYTEAQGVTVHSEAPEAYYTTLPDGTMFTIGLEMDADYNFVKKSRGAKDPASVLMQQAAVTAEVASREIPEGPLSQQDLSDLKRLWDMYTLSEGNAAQYGTSTAKAEDATQVESAIANLSTIMDAVYKRSPGKPALADVTKMFDGERFPKGQGYAISFSLEEAGKSRTGDIFVDLTDKTIQINLSQWGEGGRGSAIYKSVFDFARNNGFVFIGDAAGISVAGIKRRLESMLSHALLTGEVKHMALHPKQIAFIEKETGIKIQWLSNDPQKSIEQMLNASYNLTVKYTPEIKNVYFDFTTRSFIDSRTGAPATGIAGLVAETRRDPNAVAREGAPGGSTLERTALANTILRSRPEHRHLVFRAWSQVVVDMLPGAERLLYQQTGGAAAEGAVSVVGHHFSTARRPILEGRMYGAGIKGAEAPRVAQSKDPRIKERLHFYVDEGNGVFPEAGVGREEHVVQLHNMYDAARNPLRIKATDSNAFEAAVIDAGFDGYYVQAGFGRQGVAVLLGKASRGVVPENAYKQVEAAANNKAEESLDELKAAYAQSNTKEGVVTIDVDEARELFPEYAASNNARTRFAAAVHEASSKVAKAVYADVLKQAPAEGKLPLVIFTAGGGGSGKSSARAAQGELYNQAQAIYDGTLSDYDSAKVRIEAALAAGKKVAVQYVSRDPVAAWVQGVLPRAVENGRVVGLYAHAAAHRGAARTIKMLAAHYANNPNVDIQVIENYGGKADVKLGTLDSLASVNYNDLEARLFEALDKEFQNGNITRQVYEAAKAVPTGLQSVQPEVDGRGYFQSVSLAKGAETLKRYGLDPTRKHSTRQVAAALEARQRAKYGSIAPEDRSEESSSKVAKWIAEEVLFELENPNQSGRGWYSEKFQRALDTLADIFPELATDKGARNTLTALIAATSDGQKVVPNFKQAASIYGAYRKTGSFTSAERGHQRQDSVLRNLEVLQRLYDTFGVDGAHEYLMQEKTVSELKKIAQEAGGELKSAYQAHIKLPMAAVELGPKLGAFYANLMGAHGYLTMDRWFSRTFNRYRGVLLDAPTKAGLQRFKEISGHPEWSDDEAIAATVSPTEAYTARGFKGGTELEKAANTLHKAAFTALNDAPFNATDRTFMLSSVEKARKSLKRRGHDISTADIQAILWYYEKRLYGKLGARESADISYEEAARRVVEEGFTVQRGEDAEPSVFYDAAGIPEEQESYAEAQQLDTSKNDLLFQKNLAYFDPEQMMIAMLKGANLSSMIHESGHFYLEALNKMSAHPNATQQMRDDFDKTLKWFGIPDRATWDAMTLEQKRPYHEQWAQSNERWIMEGKAPTVEMQPIFARFRSWMLSVYKSLEQFLQQNPLAGRLDDEMRGVFSRLIAAEDAIRETEAARAFVALTKPEGMPDDEYAKYIELGEEATQAAISEMGVRTLRDMKWLSNAKHRIIRQLQREAVAKRKAIREEVTKEVMAEPVNQARTFLTKGVVTSETGEEIQAAVGHKLDAASIKEMYPATMLARPDLTKLRGMTGEGLPPDALAPMFGFRSGDALVRELIEAEPAKDKIDGLTDQRMLERHGELIDAESVERAAEAAIHNEARARFLATGLNMLTKSKAPAREMANAAKEAAANVIARKKVRELRPKQYSAAETRANRKALELAPKSPAEAADAQRAALLNNRLAAAATEALEEVDSALRLATKFQSDGVRKNLDLEYLEQIDDLLKGFDFRKGQSLKAIDKRRSFAEFVALQEERGFEPIVSADQMEAMSRKHYKDMTVEELRGLVEAVKHLEHLARLKKKLLTAKDEREFAQRIAEAVASIEANANRTVEERATPSDVAGRAAQLWRGFAAEHRKVASIVREMDGSQDGGVMWDLFIRPMNEAADNETAARAQAAEKMGELFAPIRSKMGGIKGHLKVQRTVVPGTKLSMSYEERVMFALNWGNEGNRQRLLDGGLTGKRSLSEEEAQAVLATLDKQDWDFAQGVWDYLETFRPAVAEMERELTGKEPKWIEPASIQTRFGIYKGGYFPAKYDAELSTRSESLEAAATLRMGMKGAFGNAGTRNGYTQKRAEQVVDRPILLSFNVISQHVSEVTHRVAWQRWVVDANRILRALDGTVRDSYGPEILREMKKLVEDVAAGDAPAANTVERVINHLRVGSTIVGMGWRVTTAMLQPSGLAQSWVRIGGKWTSIGVKKYLSSPIEAAEFAESRSKMMRDRSRTMQREINEILNTVRVGDKVSNVQASYFWLIAKMQRTVDVPTWHGAYEKAIAQLEMEKAVDAKAREAIEEKAVAMADQAVIDAQSGGQLKDLARVQRGSPIYKLFTNFYSYFSATYNLNVESYRRTKFSDPAQLGAFVADMLILNTLPVLFSVALKEMLKGGCDNDDVACLLKQVGQEQTNYLFGQMILLREAGAAAGALTGDSFGYTGPAGLRFFSDMYKAGQQVGQGEADFAAWKAVTNTLAVPLHLPMGQVNSTLEGIIAIENGDVEGVNVLSALVAGKPREEK